ncbi:DUF3021 family protein [Limosilactobacillus sp. Sa3CUN2]|uniref:DUF3021 family protein n=1 Tax=Limosilactobacillus avistercoris TaxID=2762243 RepID=A0ABR8PA11_9LACO|nr:DUF3021 family protein [Limosilactobacillus avistercoris]MBD7894140.1 DUF3021 family protein [Limosilactobacillus avistercoris]
MSRINRWLRYFVTGVGYGAITYLVVTTFLYVGMVPTKKEVISVFIVSGLIGLLTIIFESDLAMLPSLVLHLFGTFLLFLLMVWINHWTITWLTFIIFLVVYLIIWLICIIEQRKSINKINSQLKKLKR